MSTSPFLNAVLSFSKNLGIFWGGAKITALLELSSSDYIRIGTLLSLPTFRRD